MKWTMLKSITTTDLVESAVFGIVTIATSLFSSSVEICMQYGYQGVSKTFCSQFINDFKGFDNVAINKTLVTTDEELDMYLGEENSEEENVTGLFEKQNQEAIVMRITWK